MNIEILKTQNTQENIPTTYLIRQSEYIAAKRMCEMSKYCTAVVIRPYHPKFGLVSKSFRSCFIVLRSEPVRTSICGGW